MIKKNILVAFFCGCGAQIITLQPQLQIITTD